MNFSKKTAYQLSLTIIILYWLYELFVIKQNSVPDGNFSTLAVTIVIKKTIHLAVIVLLLTISKDGWEDMGFRFKNLRKQFLTGIFLGLLMFLIINVGLTSILNGLFPLPATSKSILAYFSERQNLYIWLAIGVLGGGFVEEVMRIFMLTRFQKIFGRPGLYFALVMSSFLFGAGHLYQGIGSAISTGISGLLLGCIFIRRGSAIEIITIHAISDVLAILAAYYLAGHHAV
jgi:membrane protease YdiL (CAAX protease family)